ncbi:MAG TPA: hypothetical protein VFF06_13990 [Polyangia bacterium]|nr:hypothetical protein [Polyangia bacterium]
MSRTALALLSILAVAPGCKRRAAAPAPAAAAPAPEPQAESGGGQGQDGDEDDNGQQRRFHNATVFVDGVPTVAFTYNEMPPGVKVYQKEWEEGEFYSHFLVCDYFKALGVDCKDVKETHWYAGRSRIAIITGDEIRRNKDTLFFNFTRELAGKPRVEWSAKVRTNDHVDLVSALAIYVHKKPPRWDKDAWTLYDDKGEPIDGIPYLAAEQKGGLRVNIDGRLVAQIKRNLLDGNVAPLDEKDGTTRYALAEFLRSQKIALGPVRGIDLITREERVIRTTPEEARGLIAFAAPRQRHGEMMVYFGQHFVPVAAINIYSKLAPPTRNMRTVTIRGPVTAGGVGTSQVEAPKVQGRR